MLQLEYLNQCSLLSNPIFYTMLGVNQCQLRGWASADGREKQVHFHCPTHFAMVLSAFSINLPSDRQGVTLLLWGSCSPVWFRVERMDGSVSITELQHLPSPLRERLVPIKQAVNQRIHREVLDKSSTVRPGVRVWKKSQCIIQIQLANTLLIRLMWAFMEQK